LMGFTRRHEDVVLAAGQLHFGNRIVCRGTGSIKPLRGIRDVFVSSCEPK
jgi:hypothetical protein